MPFKFHRNGRHHIPRQKFPRDELAGLRSRIAKPRKPDDLVHRESHSRLACSAACDARQAAVSTYSDLAIETALTLRGCIPAWLCVRREELGRFDHDRCNCWGLTLPVPDHTTFSRRAGGLKVLQKPRASSGPAPSDHRQHRPEIARRRRMAVRKAWNGKAARLAQTSTYRHRCRHGPEIVASDLTDKDVDDASHVGPMLDQLSLAPTSFIGDGAYDRGLRP